MHEAAWPAIEKARPLCMGHICVVVYVRLCQVSSRHEGGIPGRNDKGLVTYDRKVKKDAFYYYKANWNAGRPHRLHHQPPLHRTYPTR